MTTRNSRTIFNDNGGHGCVSDVDGIEKQLSKSKWFIFTYCKIQMNSGLFLLSFFVELTWMSFVSSQQ